MGVIKNCEDLKLKAQDLREELQDKLEILEDKEPDSDGVIYEKWEERKDDLEEVLDSFDTVIEKIEQFKSKVLSHQIVYGGLKR